MLAASLILACQALAASCFAAQTEDARKYEAQYDTTLVPLVPDETYRERLSRLAFGSCQDFDFGDNRIFPVINSTDPDLFLYTGDIIYPDIGCCTPDCIIAKYEKLNANAEFQEFRSKLRRMDGIYDDHDFGIDDGHSNFPYRAESQRLLMDFLQKPEDHYRRKREGAYFSMEYEDPENEHHRVKIIVLDVRYHRDCYYYCRCDKCLWKPMVFNKMAAFRLLNYFLGFGCNHKGDTLGAEQWRWLEGQLHDSEAEAHIIVSSIQIFTGYPLSESWGLLPEAKDRLVELLLATQPKNPIFVSGDVHYGELLQKDGVVEVTSSSLTHSFMMQKKSLLRPFAISLFVFKCDLYLFNNFGAIEFRYDQNRDALKWDAKILSTEGLVMRHYTNDTARDPRAMYRDLRGKSKSFFKDTRLVKCRGLLWRVCWLFLMVSAMSWMVLTPYIALRAVYRFIFLRRKVKTQ